MIWVNNNSFMNWVVYYSLTRVYVIISGERFKVRDRSYTEIIAFLLDQMSLFMTRIASVVLTYPQEKEDKLKSPPIDEYQ